MIVVNEIIIPYSETFSDANMKMIILQIFSSAYKAREEQHGDVGKAAGRDPAAQHWNPYYNQHKDDYVAKSQGV